ncbi:MAG: protein kinase [bacterium]
MKFRLIVSAIILIILAIFIIWWLFRDIRKGFKKGVHVGVLSLTIALSILMVISSPILAVVYDNIEFIGLLLLIPIFWILYLIYMQIRFVIIGRKSVIPLVVLSILILIIGTICEEGITFTYSKESPFSIAGLLTSFIWIFYLIYLQIRFVVIGRKSVISLVVLSIIAGILILGNNGEILDPFFPKRYELRGFRSLFETAPFYDAPLARYCIFLIFMWVSYLFLHLCKFIWKIICIVNLSLDNASKKHKMSSKQENVKDTIVSMNTAIRVKEKYEILREIGRGGMGIVYEAVNKKLGKKVALKKMKEELAINPREKERFLKEARRVAELHHPHIVDIYDIVEEGNDIFLVFEFVDGKTIEQILNSGKKFEVKEAVKVLNQVCEALKYAHSKKIIHRDVKPSNIIVGGAGETKVMDFGIAREAKNTYSRLTGKDTSGTLAYMAPEQELGSYDVQSDIFSVGVCLYEMLTGELPFKGPNFLAQKERMVYRTAKEINPEISEKIEEIIRTCLQVNKENRYSSVEKLEEELKKLS